MTHGWHHSVWNLGLECLDGSQLFNLKNGDWAATGGGWGAGRPLRPRHGRQMTLGSKTVKRWSTDMLERGQAWGWLSWLDG